MSRARATPVAVLVRAVRRRLRAYGAGAVAAGLLAIAGAALVGAWLAGGSGMWRRPAPGPVVLLVLAIAGAVVLALSGLRRWVWRVDDGRAASCVEDALGLPAGRVRGVLELCGGVPPGTSAVLHRSALSQLSERVGAVSPSEAVGPVGRRARVRLAGVASAAGVLGLAALALGLAAPERAEAGWAPLLRPLAQLRAPVLPPVVVSPGDTAVARGAHFPVRVTAPGRATATLRWRSAGEVPRQIRLTLASDTARADVGPVDAPLAYWLVTPDGAPPDTFRVRPVDPLLVTAVSIDVSYPAYLDRAAEHYGGDLPPLTLPAGTRLGIRGRGTRNVASARLVGPDTVRLGIDGPRFSAQWRPGRSGRYVWSFTDDAGAPAGSTPGPLDLTMAVDSAPTVQVVFPGADTVMPLSLRQPITADARDDHGLAAAALVSWRISALGGETPPATQALPVERGRARVLLNALLDANGRGLLPGDTLRYFVRVRDNAPDARTGRSRTYALRLPAMAELRRQTRADARSIAQDATGLADEARQLETETRDLNRRSTREWPGGQRAPASGRADAPGGRLDYQAAQQARAVLQKQEDLVARADSLHQRVEALRRAMDQAGLQDPELQARLEELSRLYSELLTPELRKQMAALRKALSDLDPAAVMRALQELARHQAEFRQRVDRSLELFRRAAAEQAMSALAEDARELSTRQAALAQAMDRLVNPEGGPPGDSLRESAARRAGQQDALAGTASRLAGSLDSLQDRLDRLHEARARDAAGDAAAQTRDARGAMQRASRQVRDGSGRAGASGRTASSSLDSAAARLDAARLAMAEGWRRETQRAVREAAREALALARRQQAVRSAMQRAQARGGTTSAGLAQIQAAQAAVEQGVEQLGHNLSEASQRSAMIDRRVGAALGGALIGLGKVQSGLEQGVSRRDLPVAAAAAGVDALNQLALALLRNGDQIAHAQSVTGLQQALDELARLARQQASLNGQTGAMAPLGLTPGALAQQLQGLARRQKDIADRLGDVAGRPGVDDALPGSLDALAAEAHRLADELNAGRLTPQMLERQAKLFHRLLDAGRSMQQDEPSNERVAERPGDVAPATADELDPSLLDARLRFPPPDPAQLQALPPEYRRLILQYFDRLNRGASSGAGSPPGGAR